MPNKSFPFTLAALAGMLLSGCIVGPPPNRSAADPSDPGAPATAQRPYHPNLIASTQVYLDPDVGKGAQKMEHGNMQMGGMDHSQMQGMEAPGEKRIKAESTTKPTMEGMDHSQMGGMDGGGPTASPSPDDLANTGGVDAGARSKGEQPQYVPQQDGRSSSPPPASPGMQGMDHSKMQGMQHGAQSPAPNGNKEQVAAEMKKTSHEMKKTSDELKAKADAAKKREKKEQRSSPAANAAQEIYTCPMHPEVQQPKPGKCPKCGMTLVKKE